MASVNKVILLGNLGRDPETRYMPNGEAVTNISIATSERWKDKQTGEQQEKTEWHRITFYRRLAEIAGEYLKKGSSIYVEGKLETRKWTDKDGKDRYTTEIIASDLRMLGSPTSQDEGRGEPRREARQEQRPARSGGGNYDRPPPKAGASIADLDDDIPFANPYRGVRCYVI